MYEFANETAEKLKLGEEELMYIETEYVEKSVEIQSDFSVRHDNLKPEEYRLRFHIKEKLDKLRAAKGEILIATYSGERPKGSDIENTLFYNIGTGEFGKIFTDFPKQVAFWEHPDDSTHKYKYRYKVEKASEDAHKTKDFPKVLQTTLKRNCAQNEWWNGTISPLTPNTVNLISLTAILLRLEKTFQKCNFPNRGKNLTMSLLILELSLN